MLLNISSYASADLLDLFDQASLLKHMKKYSIAREWASNCSHYPVVQITPGYLTLLATIVVNHSFILLSHLSHIVLYDCVPMRIVAVQACPEMHYKIWSCING